MPDGTHNNDLLAVASLRARLWAAGFRPVALYTNDKRPFGDAWQERARRDKPEAAEAPPRADALNTGILCDGLRALDIDVDDDDLAARVEAEAVARLGAAPVRYRDNSGRRLLVYRAAEGEPPKRALSGKQGKVEVLGRGQQFHAYGRHPTGAVLCWRPDNLGAVRRDLLPVVDETQITSLFAAVAPWIEAETPKAEASTQRQERDPSEAHAASEEVAELLACIPNAGPADWERFNRIGMAIYAARGGADDGLQMFRDWASRNSAYEAAEVEGRWANYRRSPPTKAGLHTLRHLSAPVAPREKRPLHREVPLPRPFPIEALGPLRKAAEAIQSRTQVPPALAAQSVLAVATLAAQAHADVRLPHGAVRPLVSLFLTIAGSGERKTSADNIALAEAHKVEEEWRAAHADDVDAYKRDLAAYKEATEAAKRGAKQNGRAAIREALASAGQEPREPPRPMMLVSDPTPEGLVMHLANSRPWAGLFTSEGGLFVGGHAMNDENRMRTAGLLNTLWDGAAIRRQRVLTGFAFLPGRRVSAHLMMQSSVAARLMGDAMLDDMGLLARCLTVEPESTIGTRLFREAPEAATYHLGDYHHRIGRLLRLPPRTREDDDRILDPRVIELSDEARELWIAHHDEVERDLADGGALRPVRGFGAKLAEHAARLAAVLTIYENADAERVPGENMAHGITLALHYAAEALRLQGAAAVAPDLMLAARLLRWWQERPGPRLHLAQVYQRGLNALDSAEKARRVVNVLVAHGYAVALPAGTEVDGTARREAWELVP